MLTTHPLAATKVKMKSQHFIDIKAILLSTLLTIPRNQ
jgi:hypothetical protein